MKMQKIFTVIGLSLLFTSPANANWWEKGLEAIKGSGSTGSQTDNTSQFSSQELESAFREALSIGSKTVVDNLSVEDSFNLDPKIHIPLPDSIASVKSGLGKVGLSSYVDDLELTLNRAAEAAAPETKAIFLEAIKSMSFEDVQKIYNGPDNSATEYLKKTTHDNLKSKIEPIVQEKLNEVGAVTAYDSLTSQYRQQYPFLPNLKADLSDHVVGKAMDGIFYYLAQQEASIRKDPFKYGSNLLEKVFSK